MGYQLVECPECKQMTALGPPRCGHCDKPLAGAAASSGFWRAGGLVCVATLLAICWFRFAKIPVTDPVVSPGSASAGPAPQLPASSAPQLSPPPVSRSAAVALSQLFPSSAPASPRQLPKVTTEFVKAQLEKARAARYTLGDGVMVLPLTDATGRTTALGSAISAMAMYRATFVPQKVLALDFANVWNWFRDRHYFEAGRSIVDGDLVTALQFAGTKKGARGTLTRSATDYAVELTFEGPQGAKKMSTSVPHAQAHLLPCWVARSVHGYAGTPLTTAQLAYLDRPDVSSEADLLELARLESLRPGDAVTAGRTALFALNKDSALMLMRWVCGFEDCGRLKPPEYIKALPALHLDHDHFRRIRAGEALFRKNIEPAVVDLLELLERDYRGPRVYDLLNKALEQLGLWEARELVCASWIERVPDSAAAQLAAGEFWHWWGWEARGAGMIDTVTRGGYAVFRERLTRSRDHLEKAHRLDPKRADIPAQMILTLIGLEGGVDLIEEWFRKGLAADPGDYTLHYRKLEAMHPKWGGDMEQMLAFARQAAASCAPESNLAHILWDAHKNLGNVPYRDNSKPELLEKHRWLLRDMQPAYEKLLKAFPDFKPYLAEYAFLAYHAKEYRLAHSLFERIGEGFSGSAWKDDAYYAACRSKARAEALAPPPSVAR